MLLAPRYSQEPPAEGIAAACAAARRRMAKPRVLRPPSARAAWLSGALPACSDSPAGETDGCHAPARWPDARARAPTSAINASAVRSTTTVRRVVEAPPLGGFLVPRISNPPWSVRVGRP